MKRKRYLKKEYPFVVKHQGQWLGHNGCQSLTPLGPVRMRRKEACRRLTDLLTLQWYAWLGFDPIAMGM